MENQTTHKWFIRIGLLIIGFAGLVFAVGDSLIPQTGAMFMASEDPEAFAELVTMQGYKYWALRGIIGIPMEAIGTIALFLAFMGTGREKLALWGMLLCLLADLFGAGFFMISYYVFPQVGELMQAGNEAVSSIAAAGQFMPIMGGGFIVTTIGLILFAIAIWKSKIFPKWSGWIVLLGWLMLLVQVSYIIQIAGNVVWGAGYLWMAIAVWKKLDSSTEVA